MNSSVGDNLQTYSSWTLWPMFSYL